MSRLPSHGRPFNGSLKRQIRILGLVVLAHILLAAIAVVVMIRHNSSVHLADANRRLENEIQEFVERYASASSAYRQKAGMDPLRAGEDALLRSLTVECLFDHPGMEGGFFDAASGRLLGYASPTAHDGARTEMPAAQRPAVDHLVRRAVDRRSSAKLSLGLESDVLVFRAHSLGDESRTEGAVWLMERVSGIRALQNRLYPLGLLVWLSLFVATMAFAWKATRRLDRGVQAIESGLRAKEENADSLVPNTGVDELDRIGAGIDRLARALQEHRRAQESLENRLHRADHLAAIGRLVAGVAHEVRNPLASIKLRLHLIRKSQHGTRESEAAFSVVEEEISRLNRLVVRLLTLSKPDQSGADSRDLAQLVESRAQLWSAQAGQRGIRLETRVDETARGATRVETDPILSILDNLLSNAIEAIDHGGGTILLTLEGPSASEVIVAVSDSGPGIDPSLVDRLFEPFFTTREGGTGLGLFLAAEMANRLGGDIRYTRAPEGGARFELRLPC